MAENKFPTSIALESDLIEKLEKEREKRGLDNRSQTIRQILREYFKSKA